MKIVKGVPQFSASDLVNYLSCNHSSMLDIQVANGNLKKPSNYDPLLEILRERGQLHEAAFIEHLKAQDKHIVHIEGVDINDKAVEDTLNAMKGGAEIIVQAALCDGQWVGRADILRKIDIPSSLGDWSYEVIDTKLARETKGGSVLQLCLYADLLEKIQGHAPEFVYIVSPWSDYEPQAFRYADFAAYYRQVKNSAFSTLTADELLKTYPDPKSHCDICRWRNDCDAKRREDDHLCLVANISKLQINELQNNDVQTTQALAELPSPLPFTPQKGSPVTFEKIKVQAFIQVEARKSDSLKFKLIDIVPGIGLAALPEPSKGDVFFDIEGDSFVGEHGMEYLFGHAYLDDNDNPQYKNHWAFTRDDEKKTFEEFVGFVTERRKQFPDMHVYHFAPYEPSALKRLMGRYASMENEVDNLLRGLVFVDLLSVVRNAMYASVESYSIKKLEPFYGFTRKTPLHDANVALTKLTSCLQLNDLKTIDDATKSVVEQYNSDDCLSAFELRNWLEDLRAKEIANGKSIPRPVLGQQVEEEELSEQGKRILELIVTLTADVPVDIDERTKEQQASWILAYLLEWHRREEKATWWEYFRLSDLTADDLLGERAALARLSHIKTVETTARGIPTDRYRFEQQDTDIRGSEDLCQLGGVKFGSAVSICSDNLTIDIKKTGKTKDDHPEAVFAHTHVPTKDQAASLFRIGEYVAENGIEGAGRFKSGRDLLLRNLPDLQGEPLRMEGEVTLDAARRICKVIGDGVLSIQGPPGTGKSYTGARMICQLIKEGKKVGITANSHKVIRNLIDKTLEAAEEEGINFACIQKAKEVEDSQNNLIFARKNEDVFSALNNGTAQLAGATHFLWCKEDAEDVLDVLVIDEAAQMSLANVLAISPAAKTLIMLGDPQQLDQPTQGSHPDGTGISALDHILDGEQTIKPDQGLFIEKTWRLHPDICRYNSELFYESKLESVDGCEQQQIDSQSRFNGAGLRYVPVRHTGNTSSSTEEADKVKEIVDEILAVNSTWTDRTGVTKPVAIEDIIIIAPYNAQVFEIQQRLPNAHVGTVDKFQGQEAAIAIYSLATSSYADAARGIEFLYSSNRINVAISRAQCLAIMVGSPSVFEVDCKTPRQMPLANAFCRYLELAETMF
ncbi:MAG: TM0106 family RecB-like putative nuclease [Candidatus Scalindua sp. AMX11]|nr:MAG: TM0106 family RecB-like putative nuclease [Candidatus Scalindua sp. SCAELEC01]TDE63321.1 MAG: TM0106 family RecB-like putative nuclease [Candidatus Scalindua sp. AMX11]GJQ60898.1 MAG: nuclease [Candidatus Scalindua sp.]